MKASPEWRSLPVAERIQLVEDLWDSIAEDASALPLTEAQRAELDRRLDDFESQPTSGEVWCEVRRKIRSSL